jgi:hypothetical protein
VFPRLMQATGAQFFATLAGVAGGLVFNDSHGALLLCE